MIDICIKDPWDQCFHDCEGCPRCIDDDYHADVCLAEEPEKLCRTMNRETNEKTDV